MAHLYLRRLQASDTIECELDFGTAELNATCCDGLLDGPSRARGPRLMIGLASAIAAAVSALIKRATAADTF